MLDHVDLLVGTSIGALNASCLACGGLADERRRGLADPLLGLEHRAEAALPEDVVIPATALSWAIPEPMVPAPATPRTRGVSPALTRGRAR